MITLKLEINGQAVTTEVAPATSVVTAWPLISSLRVIIQVSGAMQDGPDGDRKAHV